MAVRNLNQVVLKLNSLLEGRFGVTFQYVPVSEDKTIIETVKRNAGAPLIITGGQLVVPMRVNGVLVGAAIIPKIESLEPKFIVQIKDTIDLVLGSFLEANDQLESLDFTERYLENQKTASNVIRLDDRRPMH